MNTFEDRLLTELRQRVSENPTPAARRPRRGRLVIAGSAVAASAAAAVVVALSGGASAYAVEKTGNGAVSVHIRSLSDAAGLQSELRAAGIPAVVTYGATELPCGGGPPRTAGGPTAVRGQEFGTSTGGPVGTSDSGPSTSEAGTPPPDGARITGLSTAHTDDGVVFTIAPGALKSGEHVYIATTTGTVDSVGMAIC